MEPLAPLLAVSEDLRRLGEKGRAVLPPGADAIASHPSHVGWLESLAQERLATAASNLANAVRRAGRHLAVLPMPDPRGATEITQLDVLGSESHNGGQRPVAIRFSAGQAVVYKPVDLEIDRSVTEVLDGLQRRARLDGLFRVLRYAPCGPDYGFVEHVPPGSRLRDRASAERYFFRFGALIAVAYGLNVTDMHMENVLAVGEHPQLIDLETALYRFPESIRPTDVSTTGLVGRGGDDATTSGLQGGGPCRRWGIRRRLRGSRLMVVYRHAAYHAGNRPRGRDGRLLDPADFRDEVVAGFDLGYRLLREDRAWALRHLEANAGGMRVRHIVRFTVRYLLYVFQLLQPASEAMPDRRAALLRQLVQEQTPLGPPLPAVAHLEAHDLLRGDVPYFWTRLDSTELEHHARPVAESPFETSPLTTLREQLERLSPADRRAQRTLLGALLS